MVFFGEDIAAAGGVFKATPGLAEKFGPERVFDTPISELALAGMAYGAAVTGLRPVFEIMFGDFMALPMDSLVNQAAKFWYISNEQGSVPLVVRSAVGGGGRFGAIHSQTHATWFQGVPGLKIVFPSSPAEAKGLLKASIRDENPGHLPRAQAPVLGQGPGARAGGDPDRDRRDRPLRRRPDDRHDRQVGLRRARGRRDAGRRGRRRRGDRPALACARSTSTRCSNRSAARIGCLPSRRDRMTGGWASGLLGAVAAAGLHELDDAWLLTTAETPIPYSPTLEDAFIPDTAAIVATVRERAGVGAR